METLNPTQTTHQKQLIDVKEVKAITGLSVTSIYKYVNQGIFPQPKKCGRSTRWKLADIMEYVNS